MQCPKIWDILQIGQFFRHFCHFQAFLAIFKGFWTIFQAFFFDNLEMDSDGIHLIFYSFFQKIIQRYKSVKKIYVLKDQISTAGGESWDNVPNNRSFYGIPNPALCSFDCYELCHGSCPVLLTSVKLVGNFLKPLALLDLVTLSTL